MFRIHIIGRKNHGKTRLVVELTREFTSRGLKVGTIKHTHHRHELDVAGKDSHQHRLAGAEVVGILSQQRMAIFLPSKTPDETADRYSQLLPFFSSCDLVIVEGDSQTTAPKIEVWRAANQTEPLAPSDDSILAVVTDDPLTTKTAILSRSDVSQLANWIMELSRRESSTKSSNRSE